MTGLICEECGAGLNVGTRSRPSPTRFCSRRCCGRASRTHGQSYTRTYRVWVRMKERCTNPMAPGYARYGGRGIRVCDAWATSFEVFLRDMGERPAGMSLDRFPDNDGNYEPGNCRWATSTEQANNRSSTRVVEIEGVRRSIAEWARLVGISPQSLGARLAKGMVGRALLASPSSRARDERTGEAR